MKRRNLADLPNIPLYHWSPVSNRLQIIRYGLRPQMRPCIHTPGWRAPYICFADSPSWAWALSAGMPHGRPGEWDLWQCWADRLADSHTIPSYDRPSGIQEVRVSQRVYKRNLWHVGTRTRSGTP